MATVSIKPLPCPFCGKTPYFIEGWTAPAGVGMAWGISITCAARRCKVNPQLSVYTRFEKEKKEVKEKAIKTWNKRK